MDKNQEQRNVDAINSRSVHKSTSLGTLLAWNISKALEKNPSIDLKSAIKAAQVRLERDGDVVISQRPEERHVECALLAWQQLGHTHADSLYKFYEKKKMEQARKASMNANKMGVCTRMMDVTSNWKHRDNIDLKQSKGTDSASFISYVGPVVKLPVETKIIMRMENTGSARQTCKKPRADEKNIMSKIDAACCLDSGCIERLSALDATTSELRLRAAKLAQREAERAELLERAEAAWKNLELGYQRRLALGEEKEDDITKQTQKLIEERNGYKNVCTTLVQQLKERGDAAEKERQKLSEVEKTVYDRACVRLRLSEQVARGEAALAEQHCRAAQLDRDLQFKEEEARRKLRNIENEMESSRALTHDTERAMRAELGAIKEQVAHVSQQLLEEDHETGRIKRELEELQIEKMGMVEDLEGCQATCDKGMQGKMDELKKKKKQLNDLSDKVIECRCKFPIDATIEVKRTPSLAALCRCTPEEKILESCSCTSLRSQLLSNLLSDLFGGLLAELGSTGTNMPCQLLKCLEDKHNWDRSSVLKTNLRSFFAKLLMGELDIAIATSIEKYHAKWVGATCADIARVIPDTCASDHTGWQERAMERRAQKLASKLAEQLFQERADQLAQRAKDIVTAGPPPCECRPQSAAYPCIVKSIPPIQATSGPSKSGEGMSPYLRRTLNDVTQLRLQIEDLKKDSIKKADLKIMENKIAKLVKRSPVSDSFNAFTSDSFENTLKGSKPTKLECTTFKKKSSFINSPKKGNTKVTNMKYQMDKSPKTFNKLKQTFAVNLCLCGSRTGANNAVQDDSLLQNVVEPHNDEISSWKQKASNSQLSQISSVKKTKPINTQLPSSDMSTGKKTKSSLNTLCPKDCACFHKKPSNTSIDKLLNTIAKWKNDLTNQSGNKGNTFKMKQTAHEKSHENSMKDKSSKVSYKLNDEAEKKPVKISGNSSLKSNNKTLNAASYEESNIGNLKDGGIRGLLPKTESQYSRAHSPSKGHNKTVAANSYDKSKRNLEDTEIRGVMPRTTESEYIGTVNLDKSNEDICKCDTSQVKCVDSKFPIKCISFNECHCKKSSEITPVLAENLATTDSTPSGKGCPGAQKRKSLKSMIPQEVIPVEIPIETPEDNEPQIQDNDIFSCDCGISLLGVTIVDKAPRKRKKSRFNKNRYSDDDYDGGSDCCRMNKFKSHKVRKSGSKTARKKNTDYFSKSSCNRPPCRCEANFVEIKDFISNIYTKHKECSNVDKGIDVVDTVEGEQKAEGCICCNINDVVETKNLEENTFNLLEVYLKDRLEEFKARSCKSSCIPSKEEDKIFATIIQKVKQIILDTTNNVSCRCSSKPPVEESWNRAYSLLQEYLKTKIQRVQCQCTSADDSSPIDNILSRVCTLIQDDFDRLKSICKCQKTNENIALNDDICPILCEEIPVKDVNNSPEDIYSGKNKRHIAIESKISKRSGPEIMKDSLKSVIITENMSSQVPLNLGMESKSCNVIEKDTVDIQTSEIKKISAYNECRTTISKPHIDCCCDVVKKKFIPRFGFGTNEVLVNHCTKLATEECLHRSQKYEISSKSHSYPGLDSHLCRSTDTENLTNLEGTNEKHFNRTSTAQKTINLPYVGYTVDCSCDRNIGACICMKSVVQANNDKIMDIWKTNIDYNKPKMLNVSYIMNTASYKPTMTIDLDKVIEETHKTSNPCSKNNSIHNYCEVQLSAHGEDEITLKESRKNVDAVHNAACNAEIVNSDLNCLQVTESLDWCECSSRPVNVSNPDESDNMMYFTESLDTFHGDVGDQTSINPLPKNCDCDVVPICHVKMLVESIENKLIQSRCTCDSLVSTVCPIHSLRFLK